MNKTVSIFAVAFLIQAASLTHGDSLQHSPRVGSFDYQIGGGYISGAPTPITTIPILNLGVGWDLNMECGGFDPIISLGNQFNGATDGFRDMIGSVMTNASSALVGLPALVLQRADPATYDLIQQGIVQGKMDFEYAQTSCEDLQAVMIGEQSFPFEDYKLASKGSYAIGAYSSSGGDPIAAKNDIDSRNHGNDGVDWVCGTKKAGSGMEPIVPISDVVIAGYNIMFGRNNVCSTATISAAVGVGMPLWEYWTGPLQASTWAKDVLGDIEIRTCSSCTKMASSPGKGLTYKQTAETNLLATRLENLVNEKTQLTFQNLNLVSAPPGVRVDAAVIRAIQKRSPQGQAELISRLASEISFAKLNEQGKLLTQMLRTGIMEANMASFEPATEIVEKAIDQLSGELTMIQKEISTRQSVAENTLQRIMSAEEKRIQDTVVQPIGNPAGVNSVGMP